MVTELPSGLEGENPAKPSLCQVFWQTTSKLNLESFFIIFCFKFDSEWARWRLWHKNLSYLIIKFFVPSSSRGVVSIISLSSSSTSSSSSSCRSKEVSYVCCQKLSFAKKLSQLNFSAKTTFCRKSISLFVFHASLWKQKLTLLDQFRRLLCLAQCPPYLHRTVLL